MKIWQTIVLLCMGILAGCAGNSGHMKFSPELTRDFEAGRPPPEYRYYATGRENIPNAVIGINRKYRQRARFWREIDAGSEDLIRAIQNVFPYRLERPRASYLLSPDGDIIGIYWSVIYWTNVRMGKDNDVYVLPPRPPDGDGGDRKTP